MDDNDVLDNINALVDEEHRLRQQIAGSDGPSQEQHNRLQVLEERLDQCWDLLRQRRARHQAGNDPDAAATRPAAEVEHYLQ